LPGALVPGLKSEFAQVVREPVPSFLAELMRRLDEEPNDSEGAEQHHGPSTAKTADSADREDDGDLRWLWTRAIAGQGS
jgi:hypothetical protein